MSFDAEFDFDPSPGAEVSAVAVSRNSREAPAGSNEMPTPQVLQAVGEVQNARDGFTTVQEQEDASLALALQLQEQENRRAQGGRGGSADWGGEALVAVAQPVVEHAPTPGNGLFNVVWVDRHSGGEVGATIDVSVAGVRVETADAEVVLYRDFYNVKSWDVGTSKFGLKLIEGTAELGEHLIQRRRGDNHGCASCAACVCRAQQWRCRGSADTCHRPRCARRVRVQHHASATDC